MTLDKRSLDRYCLWCRWWCAGQRSQAAATLCHHGLVHALVLTAARPRPASPPSASPVLSASVHNQAASMIFNLLQHA